jgi:hypothetical protein
MSIADPTGEKPDDAEAGASQQAGHLAAGAPFSDLPIAPDLGLTALLASDEAGAAGAPDLPADLEAYDGHVALALDPAASPDIDSTLDLLTTSPDLFDVPAMDVAVSVDDGVTS